MDKQVKQYTKSELKDMLKKINEVCKPSQQMTPGDLRINLFYCDEPQKAEAPYFWIEAHQAKENRMIKFMLEWDDGK